MEIETITMVNKRANHNLLLCIIVIAVNPDSHHLSYSMPTTPSIPLLRLLQLCNANNQLSDTNNPQLLTVSDC